MTVDKQYFIFSMTDFDGVEAVRQKWSDDGFTWPEILNEVCKVIEKQFGYEVRDVITIKGKPMLEYENDPYCFIKPWFEEEEENFPEAKTGLKD